MDFPIIMPPNTLGEEKADMTSQYCCLLCLECQTSCPAKAIRYGS